jgi:hypothetical protein
MLWEPTSVRVTQLALGGIVGQLQHRVCQRADDRLPVIEKLARYCAQRLVVGVAVLLAMLTQMLKQWAMIDGWGGRSAGIGLRACLRERGAWA